MPIKYWIDHARRLVVAQGHGTLTDEDVFGYQREVWSNPEIAGFDELVDMSSVQHIALPSIQRVRELAKESAKTDPPAVASRFAVVAPSALAYGLGRMYEIYRGLDNRSTKKVSVFRTLDEALAFLNVTGTLVSPH